jgi:transposase
VVLDKWLDHIPLERQCRILERHGLVVTSQTLWDLANALAHRLAGVERALVAHVLERPVIGLDQTSWPRLEHADSKPWQMWCLTAPGVVVHRIRDDKSAATMTDLVGDYAGTIVCDALSTHGAVARASPKITLAACWAHVFRKFEQALPDHPEAEKALHWNGRLRGNHRDRERAFAKHGNKTSCFQRYAFDVRYSDYCPNIGPCALSRQVVATKC